MTPRRIIIALLATAAIGTAAWCIVADNAATHAALNDPEAALAWSSNEASALDELAFRELINTSGDLNAARVLAERALLASPLDVRALSALGLIAERQGQQARADELMQLAAARTWRDTTTQAWLVSRDIQRAQFEQALEHIDALLRVDRGVMEQTFPLLAAYTIDQGTFDILARFLGSAPPWRSNFLTLLSGQISDAARLAQLYAMLKSSAHPATTDELAPYLDRLITDGRYAQAHRDWQETLSPQQRSKDLVPYNGDFAAPIDGLPFNWVLRPSHGMDISVVAAPDNGEGRALRFQFSGARLGSFNVGQLILLKPGEYRLTGKVRAEELRAPRGLGWQITCAETPTNALALSSLVASSMPLRSFAVDFSVPGEKCSGQWLRLTIPDRTASERQIEGQVWYEDLRIEAKAVQSQ